MFAIAYGVLCVVVLCVVALCVLVIRLLPKRQVSSRTLAAAVTIYILVGLMFAQIFQIIGELRSSGFFAQPGSHDVSYLYFSSSR